MARKIEKFVFSWKAFERIRVSSANRKWQNTFGNGCDRRGDPPRTTIATARRGAACCFGRARQANSCITYVSWATRVPWTRSAKGRLLWTDTTLGECNTGRSDDTGNGIAGRAPVVAPPPVGRDVAASRQFAVPGARPPSLPSPRAHLRSTTRQDRHRSTARVMFQDVTIISTKILTTVL